MRIGGVGYRGFMAQALYKLQIKLTAYLRQARLNPVRSAGADASYLTLTVI